MAISPGKAEGSPFTGELFSNKKLTHVQGNNIPTCIFVKTSFLTNIPDITAS
jgi:hypothetical protein